MTQTRFLFQIILLMGVFLVFTPSIILAQKPQGAKTTPVIVSPVQRITMSDRIEALGTLKANESVDLTSTVTETVTAIYFEDGQRVQKGAVLVEMDAAEERASLAEEQSILEEAKRQAGRLEPLVKKGAASESDLDQRRREVLAAKARMEAIRSRLDKLTIRAPFDGVLGLRNVSVGALAQPGTMITTIDDDSVMKLDFSVPELYLATLKPGVQIASKSRAFPDMIFTGTIASVDSRIDPITRSIEARALLDNTQGLLKPGLLMQVELEKSPREAIIVPEEALITEGSKNLVLVVREEDDVITAERVEVQLGQRQFGFAEILSGVTEGQQVVTHGTLRVRPNAPLEITAIEIDDQPLHDMLGNNP